MTVEHVDVIVVGAGLSGIGAGHYLQTECPQKSYAILEARGAIGGTWDLFRYPGIRSDSDMFTLGYSFRPWTEDRAIADGPSILQYIKDTAAEEGIDRHIRFHHKVVKAEWSTDDALWHLSAHRSDTDEPVRLTCNFLYTCSGYYRYDHGYEPDFPGRDRYQGTFIHPQHWPEDLDHAGKRIVVIGSGATAVTLIPSLADTAAHVTMLQRSPTYIAALPANDPVARFLRLVLPKRVEDTVIRWVKALTTLGFFLASRRWPDKVRKLLRHGVKMQLPKGYDIDTHFSPRYDPWDQRVCLVPDGDLFKAIKAGTASVVTDHIDTFTETGIRLQSGAELDADIVVSATGLELLAIGGMELTVDGEAIDISDTLVYKGMMLEGVPNFAMAVGYTNASWTLKCDLTCDYVCRLVNHMDATGLRQCTPVNDDPTLETAPLLDFSAGYVTRSADRFPRQGTKAPWQVSMNYVKDYLALKRSSVVDDVMRFTNPRPSVVADADESVAAAG